MRPQRAHDSYRRRNVPYCDARAHANWKAGRFSGFFAHQHKIFAPYVGDVGKAELDNLRLRPSPLQLLRPLVVSVKHQHAARFERVYKRRLFLHQLFGRIKEFHMHRHFGESRYNDYIYR